MGRWHTGCAKGGMSPLLALFRSVTQRSDERRAVPWKALMSDLAFALVTTTDDELPDRRQPRLC